MPAAALAQHRRLQEYSDGQHSWTFFVSAGAPYLIAVRYGYSGHKRCKAMLSLILNLFSVSRIDASFSGFQLAHPSLPRSSFGLDF